MKTFTGSLHVIATIYIFLVNRMMGISEVFFMLINVDYVPLCFINDRMSSWDQD